jgi:hypothetical protein
MYHLYYRMWSITVEESNYYSVQTVPDHRSAPDATRRLRPPNSQRPKWPRPLH